MKLSKFLTIALIGTVGFTTTAMAKGTTAGTRISNAPTITYSIGGATKSAKAPTASYIVDKVINFTLTRTEATEHKVVAGTTKLVEFKLTNIGNSAENFKLSKWHNVHNVRFLSKKFYVDTNRNGILDKKERVDTALVKKLAIDGSKKIWMELKIDPKAKIKKRSDSGILAQAVNNSLKPYIASAKNRMNAEDIVFADGKTYSPLDKVRDGKMTMWYGFTVVKNANNVKLDITVVENFITADPVNGICRDWRDATSGKFKAIPGATSVRTWKIRNNTDTVATNIKFSAKLDSKKERVAKNNKKTWWRNESKYVHILSDTRGKIYGTGVYNAKTNSIDFTIKEIKPKQQAYPHIVTEIK